MDMQGQGIVFSKSKQRGKRTMKECCGNCRYNKRDFSKPQNRGYSEFCCGNEESDNYSVPTFYDDTCDDFEEKE
jgi:hypothetical protein